MTGSIAQYIAQILAGQQGRGQTIYIHSWQLLRRTAYRDGVRLLICLASHASVRQQFAPPTNKPNAHIDSADLWQLLQAREELCIDQVWNQPSQGQPSQGQPSQGQPSQGQPS